MKHMVVKTGENTTDEVEVQRAVQDSEGNVIANTYAKTSGNYPNMAVGNASEAAHATSATACDTANKDAMGRTIHETYAALTSENTFTARQIFDLESKQSGTPIIVKSGGVLATLGDNAGESFYIYTNGTRGMEVDGDIRALSGKTLYGSGGEVAYKTELSNPNLIINPDFRINQRGSTSYSGAYYGVDRWKGFSGAMVTQLDDGVSVSASSVSNGWFQQPMDIPYELLAGQYVTLSAKVNGVIYKGTVQLPETEPTTQTDLLAINLDYSTSNKPLLRITWLNGNLVTNFYIYASQLLTINWVKLEFGTVATQFSPPDESIELLKCQRFYLKYANRFRLGDAYNGSSLNYGLLPLFFPVKMRTTPTISVTFSRNNSTIAGAASQINNEGCVLSTNSGYSGYLTAYCESFKADAEI